MKILVDANVLLDVALDRPEFVSESKQVVGWCQESAGSAVIAWHTVSNLYYVLRGARNDTFARRFISDILRFASVAGGHTEGVRQALALTMNDFEDALQVAAAMSAHVEWIVTRNAGDYRRSPLPALAPKDFIKRFLKS